jgi:hypothetical protein
MNNNKLETIFEDVLYNSEYEEIPNSAIYKFNYNKATNKCVEITTEIAVQFSEWLNVEYEKLQYTTGAKEKTIKELFNEFITNYYEPKGSI